MIRQIRLLWVIIFIQVIYGTITSYTYNTWWYKIAFLHLSTLYSLLTCKILLSSVDIIGKVLHENIGKSVLIKLKGRKAIKGILLRFDQQMNLFLQDSVELLEEHGKSNNLGTILIRGDNVISVSTFGTN